MARSALGWSLDDLAEASGVSRRTIAKFEAGETVSDLSRTRIRGAFEARRVKFVEDGPLRGALVRGLRPVGSP